MDIKHLTRIKHKTLQEYKSILVYILFSFPVILVVIFNVQKHCVTGFLFLRIFVKIIEIRMAYFHIKMTVRQEMELSFIKYQIC